jgi:hypothetical protein
VGGDEAREGPETFVDTPLTLGIALVFNGMPVMPIIDERVAAHVIEGQQ